MSIIKPTTSKVMSLADYEYISRDRHHAGLPHRHPNGIPTAEERALFSYVLPCVPVTKPTEAPDFNVCDLAFFCAHNKRFQKQMKLESVGDVKKLVEHVLTTFSKFPEETLADMWRTKSRVLLATYASNGGNEYKLPRSN